VTKPANEKPNVLPANVANIVAEFQRLAAAGNANARTGERQQANQTSALVIRRRPGDLLEFAAGTKFWLAAKRG
jgi:hypothetical protein